MAISRGRSLCALVALAILCAALAMFVQHQVAGEFPDVVWLRVDDDGPRSLHLHPTGTSEIPNLTPITALGDWEFSHGVHAEDNRPSLARRFMHWAGIGGGGPPTQHYPRRLAEREGEHATWIKFGR